MKSIFIFASRLRVYLTEIPPAVLFTLAIIYNDRADELMKLYPLIVVLGALMLFIGVYFFRAVLITGEEVRCVGRFSSRDKVLIKKDRTLVITLLKRKRLRIEVFGIPDGSCDGFAWLESEEPTEINLFRAKANGGRGTAKKILRYFDTPESDIEKIIGTADFSANYENTAVTTDVENESQRIKIFFKETV